MSQRLIPAEQTLLRWFTWIEKLAICVPEPAARICCEYLDINFGVIIVSLQKKRRIAKTNDGFKIIDPLKEPETSPPEKVRNLVSNSRTEGVVLSIRHLYFSAEEIQRQERAEKALVKRKLRPVSKDEQRVEKNKEIPLQNLTHQKKLKGRAVEE